MKMTVCSRAAQTHKTRVTTVKHFTDDAKRIRLKAEKFFNNSGGIL
jgi:hypothetical protein